MIFYLKHDSKGNSYAVFDDNETGEDMLWYQGTGKDTKNAGYPAFSLQYMMKQCFPNGEHYVCCFNGYENAVSL